MFIVVGSKTMDDVVAVVNLSEYEARQVATGTVVTKLTGMVAGEAARASNEKLATWCESSTACPYSSP